MASSASDGRSRRFRRALAALCTTGALTALLVAAPTPATAQSAPAVVAGATTLTPVTPCRLFDGRHTPDAGRVDATTVRVQVTGRCNVPAGARAVAINTTVSDVSEPGFVTVWPSDRARPDVSNLNFEIGHTVANAAVVQLSPTGTVDVHTHGRAPVIIDVTGAFVGVDAGPSAGRLVPVEPRRVVDTRQTGDHGTADLRVPLPSGVPADATALAVTITSVDAAGYGFLTAFPAGASRPDTSVVNTDDLNRTRANLALVPVTSGGFVVSRSAATHVLVDVWGWFTGPSADPAPDGLFVPQQPQRVWDSRHSYDPVHPGGTVERSLTPAGAAAVIANVTAIDLTADGFLSVYAAGTRRPDVSSLNYHWRHPVAALALSRVSDRGVAFYSYAGAHLAVDVAGWFTGAPVAATTAPAPNPFPPEQTPVAFISDSAFAGIRWNGALGYLHGAAWDSRLESCRRLIGASCRGREGYAPRTAHAEMTTLAPHHYGMVVMATGYNDWSGTFPWGVDAVIAEARAKGIERVLWLTYRDEVGYVSPGGASNQASFARNNAYLHQVANSGRYPELVLADWRTYSSGQRAWVTADGVHLTYGGAPQAAVYLSRKVAFLERRPCPSAIGGPVTPGGWCADPDVTGPA